MFQQRVPFSASVLLAGGFLLLTVEGCSLAPQAPVESRIRVPFLESEPEDEPAEAWPAEEAPAEKSVGPLTLDGFRLHAAANNPGLKSLYERWRQQAERAPQVRSLPEPRFTFIEYLRSVETRTGPQERAFVLSQAFPWFGKLSLRGSMEERAAAAAWQRFLGAQLALDERVRSTYAEYYYLGRAVLVTQENLTLLARLERVAREKFAAGAENHPDLIRLQVEIGRLEDRLKTLLDKKAPLQAKLNALLNRPGNTEIAWPTGLPEQPLELDPEDISDWLEKNNPEILALEEEIDRAKLGTRLAAKEYFPDFSVGVQTISTSGALAPNTRDSGEDPWMLSFSLDVPIWYSKYRAGEREARASLKAAKRARADVANQLAAEVELALYEVRDAERRIRLYAGTLIRKAEEALASTEASFQADSSDFQDLIEAERVLLEFQLAGERARADRLRSVAKLERHLGRFVIPSTNPETNP